MRRFEQAISKPRYHLMQFHRPAELKLKRWRQCNEKFVLCIFMDISSHTIVCALVWDFFIVEIASVIEIAR